MNENLDLVELVEGHHAGTSTNKAKFFGYGALLLTALAVGLFLFWSYQTPEVLKVHNSPVPVFPPEVQAGTSAVFLDIDYCKNYSLHGKVYVNLIGQTTGAKIAVVWPVDKAPTGCNHLKQVPVLIPPQTPTDTYTVTFLITYGNINPIKEAEPTEFTSQSFKVSNPKLQAGDAQVIK